MILAIRTDNPTAELYLLNTQGACVTKDSWLADRRLAAELLTRITQFLKTNNTSLDMVQAVIVHTGTGSFTGLRIGTTVANALAYSLGISVVASKGDQWLREGFLALENILPHQFVVPEYESPPKIT